MNKAQQREKQQQNEGINSLIRINVDLQMAPKRNDREI